MSIPLQMTFRNVAPTPQLEAAIRREVDRLAGLVRNVRWCEVLVTPLSRLPLPRRRHRVTVRLTLPTRGGMTAVLRAFPAHDVEIEDALTAAFAAARRKMAAPAEEHRATAAD